VGLLRSESVASLLLLRVARSTNKPRSRGSAYGMQDLSYLELLENSQAKSKEGRSSYVLAFLGHSSSTLPRRKGPPAWRASR
jgi:hypothetical protein